MDQFCGISYQKKNIYIYILYIYIYILPIVYRLGKNFPVLAFSPRPNKCQFYWLNTLVVIIVNNNFLSELKKMITKKKYQFTKRTKTMTK